jgi:hypothetical protein
MDMRQQLRSYLSTYQTTGWLVLLMAGGLMAQGLLFLTLAALGKRELYDGILSSLLLPSSFGQFIRQPWSLLTWPFFTPGFDLLRVLVNILILWSFGRIHQQLLSDRRTRRMVILSVPVIGLATLAISSLLFSGTEKLLYTSGMISVVMMLVASACVLVPDYPVMLFIFGQVKIMWIGLVLFILEWFWAGMFLPPAIAIAIGGVLGVLHVVMLRRGTDLTEALWAQWESRGEPKPRMRVKHGERQAAEPSSPRRSPAVSREPKPQRIPQEVVDTILDKISAKGYESLTREEKELLFRASSQRDGDAAE